MVFVFWRGINGGSLIGFYVLLVSGEGELGGGGIVKWLTKGEGERGGVREGRENRQTGGTNSIH